MCASLSLGLVELLYRLQHVIVSKHLEMSEDKPKLAGPPDLSSISAPLQTCNPSWDVASQGKDQSIVRSWPILSSKSHQPCDDRETTQL